MLAATKGAGSAADNADSRQKLTELPSETMLSHLERDEALHTRACRCRFKAPCETCQGWDRLSRRIEARGNLFSALLTDPTARSSHGKAA